MLGKAKLLHKSAHLVVGEYLLHLFVCQLLGVVLSLGLAAWLVQEFLVGGVSAACVREES
jgi:hypothetical protein